MPRKKISTTVYLTEDQFVDLKRLSETSRVPVSVYIRDGIDLILTRRGEVDPGRNLSVKEDRALGNLLARIHRDGGHYVAKHGLLKALLDADERWVELMKRGGEGGSS